MNAITSKLAILATSQRFWFFLLVFVVQICLFVRFREQIKSNARTAFLCISIPVGIILCFFMPSVPAVSWDGAAHYAAADYMAQGAFLPGVSESLSKADEICLSADAIYEVQSHPSGQSPSAWNEDWQESMTDAGWQRQNSVLSQADSQFSRSVSGVSAFDKKPFSLSTMFGRIPNAAGIFIARALHLNIVYRLLMGRLFNMAFWIACIFFGFSRLKRGRWLLCVFGLCPTLMFESANFSYDPFCVGLLALFACNLVGEIQRKDESLTFLRGAAIVVPFFFGAVTKAVFFPVGICMLFLPRSKFRTAAASKLWRAVSVAAPLLVLATFAEPFLVSHARVDKDLTAGSPGINAHDQLLFVLQNPLQAAAIFGFWFAGELNPRFFLDYFYVDFLFFGRTFYFQQILTVVSYVWLVMMPATAILDPDRATISSSKTALFKVFAALTVFAGTFLLFLALYLNYNTVAIKNPGGFQTRYFLTYIFGLFLICVNSRKKFKSEAASKIELIMPKVAPYVACAAWYAVFIGHFVLRF